MAESAFQAPRTNGADDLAWDAADRARLEAIARRLPGKFTPPVGAALVNNLIYAVGFVRVMGEHEGAMATDRHGTGQVHHKGDQRAIATITPMIDWILDGASHPNTVESVARVQRMHDAFAKTYSFSNETYLHGIAYFTLLFDEIFQMAGADVFSEEEKEALVYHWRTIGGYMRIQNMPTTWRGMQGVVRRYEESPDWFGPTEAGIRGAEAIIQQFTDRWFPRALHPVGRTIVRALTPEHVLDAVCQPRPPAAAAWIVRRVFRGYLLVQTKVFARFAS